MCEKSSITNQPDDHYNGLLGGVVDLLNEARQNSVRVVNSIMTASYWEVGRRIVEFEQGGDERAEYGKELIKRLSTDLTNSLGRGFSRRNIEYMRTFYLRWPIVQTLSAQSDSKTQTLSAQLEPKSQTLSGILQTPKNKGLTTNPAEPAASALPLMDIDLKIGEFSHADAGQMLMYLNYAAEHWTNEDENPPVGIILCASKDDAVVHDSLEGLPNKVMAGEYRLELPDEATLVAELKRAQLAIKNQL
jgi:hypothetical protein